jgi:hypothetical protein
MSSTAQGLPEVSSTHNEEKDLLVAPGTFAISLNSSYEAYVYRPGEVRPKSAIVLMPKNYVLCKERSGHPMVLENRFGKLYRNGRRLRFKRDFTSPIGI